MCFCERIYGYIIIFSSPVVVLNLSLDLYKSTMFLFPLRKVAKNVLLVKIDHSIKE